MQKIILSLIVTVPALVSAGPPSGKEVLAKQEEARKISNFQASATLTTANANEAGKTKKFTWWRKLTTDGVYFVTLTRFLQPATIRGEGLLVSEGSEVNDVKLYLPRFKKIRRVEGESQRSSFFGSAFSYSDVAVPHASDYTAEVKKQEACPGEAAKVTCYVVEIRPAREIEKTRTGYSRSVQWVRSDVWLTVKAEFYDLKGKLWKKLDASSVKEIDKKAHKSIAHEVRIEDVLAHRVSTLSLADARADVKIDDSTFTEQNLSTE
jgi:hypothetical protein